MAPGLGWGRTSEIGQIRDRDNAGERTVWCCDRKTGWLARHRLPPSSSICSPEAKRALEHGAVPKASAKVAPARLYWRFSKAVGWVWVWGQGYLIISHVETDSSMTGCTGNIILSAYRRHQPSLLVHV